MTRQRIERKACNRPQISTDRAKCLQYRDGFHFSSVVFVFLVLALLVVSCSKKADEGVLAEVGTRRVTEKQLNDRLAQFKKRTGITVTTGQQLKELLSGMVDEELLIGEAWKKGYGNDALAQHEKERLEIQELLDLYHKKIIRSRVQVSDAELRMLYARFNIKVKARHLFAASRRDADSLYSLLQEGSDFKELAASTFVSPELRRNGGSVGYFSVDEMDPFFEDAAFRLNVGEISEPVKTAAGFSIIQVEDKIANPILTESVFQQRKNQLRDYWFHHKLNRLTRAHVDSIAATLDIHFNDQTVQALLQALQEKKGSTDLHMVQQKESIALDENLQNAVLVESRIGKWKVSDFQEKAQFTSEKQQNWIRNPFTLREFITGLIAREVMLEKARDAGFDNTPDYTQVVQTNLETWMLQRMEDWITDQIEVPDDSMRAYFNEDPTRFAVKPEVSLNEIVVLKQETADSIKTLLEKGIGFDSLRRLYSVFSDPTDDSGNFPFYSADEFGNLANDIAALKVGENIGPLNIEEKFVFFRCEDRRPGKVRTYAEARPDVEKTLKYMAHDDFRDNVIKEIGQKYKINVYYNKIKSLRLQ
ncbi:peptidyl-prolyl cis-trans isomerase [candidate division KSB1 bacterium]|nr:peptidyl-prolyl cis-trans isomerase [candidate division KSB1 bacterium]